MKKKWRIIIIAIILVLCGVYLHYENTALTITHYEVSSELISDSFNNYKICQVSDLHNSHSDALLRNLVDEIKGQSPDIIVLTGDLIDASRTDVDAAIGFVSQIKEAAPIYFITGNHEAGTSDYSHLIERLTENEVIILDNKVQLLSRGTASINLLGIDDPKMAHERAVPDSEIIKVELSNVQYNSQYYSILLSHRPELMSIYTNIGINLVLAGHAHGGQIRIPFLGGLIAPNQGFFPEYDGGKYQDGSTTMIVSRGIGNSILPFRINNRPELVVIELSSKQ